MKASLKLPGLPNFVTATLAGKEVSVSIADVPEDELRQLAEQWVAALIESARAKRLNTADMVAFRETLR